MVARRPPSEFEQFLDHGAWNGIGAERLVRTARPGPLRVITPNRLYGGEDEERLRFVKSAQRVGLTLGEIREVLAFRDRGSPPCRYVAGLIERRLAEIDERMRELRALKQELGALRARMQTEGIAERAEGFCHYIETAAAEPGKRRSR